MPALAAAGGGALDHHKSFVVRYRVGEDVQLAAHYDNSEVTLNVNLGVGFEGGELVFHGQRGAGASAAPRAFLEWDDVGGGVLHLGRHVHAALPIAQGERLNFVMWMRSASWRRAQGCPMCDRTDGLMADQKASVGF